MFKQIFCECTTNYNIIIPNPTDEIEPADEAKPLDEPKANPERYVSLIHPLVPPKGGDGSEGDGNGADVKAADPGKDDAGGEGGNDAPAEGTAGDYATAEDALFNLLNG